MSDPERFSPDSDLEVLDIAQLRKARSTIDIAMYAFTDRRLAEELAHTDSSIQIRLYRDGEQFESEQRHATTPSHLLRKCWRVTPASTSA